MIQIARSCNSSFLVLYDICCGMLRLSAPLLITTRHWQMQIKSGRYHTLLINDAAVYSCGSSLCGVLGHGPETTQCVEFTRISFPFPVQVIQVSASHNHAAFVTQSGEVNTAHI